MAVKRLEEMMRTLAPHRSVTIMDMREIYEAALSKQGWTKSSQGVTGSEWAKDHKRMLVENGDRVFISFDQIRWHAMNAHAKKNLILGSQQ